MTWDIGDNATQVCLAVIALFSSCAGYISGYVMGKRAERKNNTTLKK